MTSLEYVSSITRRVEDANRDGIALLMSIKFLLDNHGKKIADIVDRYKTLCEYSLPVNNVDHYRWLTGY